MIVSYLAETLDLSEPTCQCLENLGHIMRNEERYDLILRLILWDKIFEKCDPGRRQVLVYKFGNLVIITTGLFLVAVYKIQIAMAVAKSEMDTHTKNHVEHQLFWL